MNLEIVENGEKKIAIVNSNKIEITTVQDALDLMANADYQGAGNIIIQKENLPEFFYDLKSKFAGEILQKFVNYRKRLAIVGDFSEYASKALQDFIFESNKGGYIFFVPSIEKAKQRFFEN